jgi:hypothetical protein
MTIQIRTTFGGLVAGLSAGLSAIESSEDFRLATIDRKGVGTELNRPVESHVERHWEFVKDLRDAFVEAGTNMERFDFDILATWRKLRAGHDARPWTGRFDRMLRLSRDMGVEPELAAAA